jgi:hypothetical protein
MYVNYLEQGQERSAELPKDMVDFQIQLIRLVKRAPSLENRVRHLQHTNVDRRVGRIELRNKVLWNRKKQMLAILFYDRLVLMATYINKSVPSLPEITIGDHADSLAQLTLNRGRDRDHQVDQLALDCFHFILRQLPVSIFVGPVALDEVLEAKGASKANVAGR